LKKPVPPSAPPATKAALAQAEKIVVHCTSDRDEIGIRTLVGEYVEEGSNHARKFYKKTQKIPGHEEINVYLYFWDSRDGDSFSGWWFGNQVGGAQVWSRNAQATQRPPRSGWTIPWDGDVKKELVVESAVLDKVAAAKALARAKMEERKRQEDEKRSVVTDAEWSDKVEKAAMEVAEATMNVNEALDAAREVLAGDCDDASLLVCQRELAAQATSLAETQRAVAVESLAAQKAPSDIKAEMTQFGQQMRELQATLKEEILKVKNGKQIKAQQLQSEEKRAEDEAKERDLEEGYSKHLEEMLPPAMEKTDAAEDEVEKVAIAAAPLQIDTGDDLRPIMLQAIKETEQRVRAAQTAIGEARRYISGKMAAVGRFAPNAKKTAVEEFGTLKERLEEMQQKLTPYKTVRQDYDQRAQAKKLHEELSTKVSGAEIEVEKAAMMTAPLGADCNEGMKETEQALSMAQSALSQALRLIDSKLKSLSGPLKEEILSLQERAKTAQEKLDEVRRNVKETQVRVAADLLLREVSDKVAHAEDELQKMSEAELPFLRSGDQKTEDIDVLIQEADKMAVAVHTAIAEAQTFIARKLVEVARFSEGTARAVKEEIDMMTKRVEDGRERLQQFRSSTGDRKRVHLLEEVDVKVKSAEDEVVRMAEATKSLSSLGIAGELASESGREAVEQANLAERSAQASLVIARKHLLQKTADLKKLAGAGAGSGSELGRLQTRVNNVQQEIAKLRNITKEAEERLRVKTMLAEVATRLTATESDVDKVAAVAVATQADEQPSPEQVERMERATALAQTKLTATSKLVDVKLKTASGVLREELSAMRSKITAAEKKLATVIQASKEQKERLICSEIVSEATEHVLKAESDMSKCGEAELPFLKGLESLPGAEAAAAVAACEESAGVTQKAIAAARTFVVQKLVDIKEFAKGPQEACAKELAALQKRLDVGAGKLAELKKDTAERKRATQMQASGQKVASVEQAVQALANAMVKFPEDKMADLSGEEAHKICEEIGAAEADAQAAVADARKFLAMRLQDVKNSKDAGKSAGSVDLTKLQSRLTQCQVELAKLSNQCTEREQRFVAQKLVQDANENMAKLRAEIEHATAVSQALLSDDKSELLTSSFLTLVAGALIGHLKASGSTPAKVFATVAGNAQSASAEDFTVWLQKLPELVGGDDACLTEDRAFELSARIAGSAGAPVTAAAFKALLQERYVCATGTAAFRSQGGDDEACTVEVGEGLELVEPCTAGAARGHFALARDPSTQVWVPLECLKASPPFVGKIESIEAFVKAVHQRCTEASQAVDQKTVGLSHVKQGPLVEVKGKLQQIRTALSTERARADALKKRVAAARAALVQQQQEEVKKVQEGKCKAFAERVVAEAAEAVEAAEARAAAIVASAKAGTAEKLQKELSIGELDALKTAADEALSTVAEARAVVARSQETHDGFKGGARNVLLESKVELTKLASRASTAERRLKAATEAVRAAFVQVAKTATVKARNVLRTAARKSGKSIDELFDTVSGGTGEISEAQFAQFVSTLPEHDLGSDQVALVYKEFGRHGLRKPGFAKALQEFCICERSTEIASSFEAAAAPTVRKLEKGELFEVLEGPAADGAVLRVRGRALRDGAAGWVTFRVGEGPPLLKPREKPFLFALSAAPLLQSFDTDASVVREMQQDEVLELLEGPRPLQGPSEQALHAVASKDGKVGWVTLQDTAGNTFASPSKNLYMCKSTIAMTDNFDIKNCKVLRKVDVGEALEVISGQEEDGGDISRKRFKSVRDGKEGWVTLKGNQGTIYVELSDSHFIADQDISMRAGASRDSPVLRTVEAGEALLAKEPPKEVRPDPKMGARARSLEDGKSGWIVFAPGPRAPVKPWKAKYVCKAPVDITSSLALQEGTVAVTKAEPGQSFQVVEGPALDAISGQRRVRLARGEEGIVGWATLRTAEGKACLEVA